MDHEWDIYDTKKRYLEQLNQIKDWDTTEKNKEKMLNFLKRIELEGVGVVQRSKYIFSFKTLLNAVNKDFDEFTDQDIENFIYSMTRYKPKTKHIRWTCIRKFLRYIGKDTLFQNIKVSFNKSDVKLPEELLSEEEVKQMVEKATNIRDKALIMTLYESGCRIGETLTRKLKHVVFDEYGAVLMVDGKTGMRRVRLIQSVPLLANWIENHPQGEPESFLWVSLNNYRTPVKYGIISKMLKETASRANIRKRIYPHLMRHSRATILANKLTEQQLKVYFGWAGASKMASIYVHLSGKDVDDAILEMNGIKPRESKAKSILKIQNCVRCGKSNSATSKFCNKCGMILDSKKAFKLKDTEPDEEFQEFLAEMFKKWKENKVSKD